MVQMNIAIQLASLIERERIFTNIFCLQIYYFEEWIICAFCFTRYKGSTNETNRCVELLTLKMLNFLNYATL